MAARERGLSKSLSPTLLTSSTVTASVERERERECVCVCLMAHTNFLYQFFNTVLHSLSQYLSVRRAGEREKGETRETDLPMSSQRISRDSRFIIMADLSCILALRTADYTHTHTHTLSLHHASLD